MTGRSDQANTSGKATSPYIQGGPKNLAHFCMSYNFIKYLPIFKLFSMSESGQNL